MKLALRATMDHGIEAAEEFLKPKPMAETNCQG